MLNFSTTYIFWQSINFPHYSFFHLVNSWMRIGDIEIVANKLAGAEKRDEHDWNLLMPEIMII